MCIYVCAYIFIMMCETLQTSVSASSTPLAERRNRAGKSWRAPSARRRQGAHTATHCKTLQHTATYCHTATHYNALQHTATHCSTLQHFAKHCNALHHTAPQQRPGCCARGKHTYTHTHAHGMAACAKSQQKILENQLATKFIAMILTFGVSQTLVSFAKEPCKRDYILQKSTMFSRSLLIIATPYDADFRIFWSVSASDQIAYRLAVRCHSLQRTALQLTATHCNTLPRTAPQCSNQSTNPLPLARAVACALYDREHNLSQTYLPLANIATYPSLYL